MEFRNGKWEWNSEYAQFQLTHVANWYCSIYRLNLAISRTAILERLYGQVGIIHMLLLWTCAHASLSKHGSVTTSSSDNDYGRESCKARVMECCCGEKWDGRT